jgi:hypothetical protein
MTNNTSDGATSANRQPLPAIRLDQTDQRDQLN